MARDCGATVIRRARPARPPVVDPDPNPLSRVPILAPLFEQRIGILSWAAGLLVLSTFLTSLVKSVVKAMRDGGGFGNYLAEVERHANVDQAFIGVFVLPVMQLLLAVYAIVCVARWSADDAEGRLAMMLSAPVTHRRVVLERAAALLIGTVVIVAAGMLGAAVVASAQHLGVDEADLARAGALLLPFTLAYGAAGAAIGGASPRLAVPLLTAVAAASYFLQQVTQLFKWPSWLSNLSVFQLYGDPLDNGVFWGGLVALFAIVCAGFAAGVVSLQRRDVAG
jgi:ABC-2 type transport system permease protein